MTDETILAKLEEFSAAISGYDDPRRAGDEWKQVYKLLQKAGAAADRVTGIVGMRNAPGLAELVSQLRNPETAPTPEKAPDAETCKKAYHAFKKRLAVTMLDEESKLGRGPLSKGGSAEAAIIPPDEYPAAVWQELVRQGKLRYLNNGYYGLRKQ